MRERATPLVGKLAAAVGHIRAFFSLTPSCRSDRLIKSSCRTHRVLTSISTYLHAPGLPPEMRRCVALTAVFAGMFIAISLDIFGGGTQAQTFGSASPSLKIVERLSRPPDVTGLAWSPDGSKLATFSNFGSVVTIWDASDWHIIREFRRYSFGWGGTAFAWMPNGLLLAPMVPENDDQDRFSLSLWDPQTGTLVKNIPGPTDEQSLKRNAASALAVSRDGAEVAIANNLNLHHVFLFETQSWSIKATLKLDGAPFSLAFGSGARLAVGTTGGKVTIFELGRRTVERAIDAFPNNRAVNSTAFSPNGELLAAVPSSGYGGVTAPPLGGGPVRIWKAESGARIAILGSTQGNETFSQVAWNADGTMLAATSFGGLLAAWRMGAAPSPVFDKRFPTYGAAVSFSPNGTLAATLGAEVLILK